MQGLDKEEGPEQESGLDSQVLCLVWVPPPQSAEHGDQADHSDQESMSSSPLSGEHPSAEHSLSSLRYKLTLVTQEVKNSF